MKKKFRNIVVNCKEYCYIVKVDDECKYLWIYFNKQPIFKEVLNIDNITPKKVSKIIIDNCL